MAESEEHKARKRERNYRRYHENIEEARAYQRERHHANYKERKSLRLMHKQRDKRPLFNQSHIVKMSTPKIERVINAILSEKALFERIARDR